MLNAFYSLFKKFVILHKILKKLVLWKLTLKSSKKNWKSFDDQLEKKSFPGDLQNYFLSVNLFLINTSHVPEKINLSGQKHREFIWPAHNSRVKQLKIFSHVLCCTTTNSNTLKLKNNKRDFCLCRVCVAAEQSFKRAHRKASFP